jgi:hypothetical protein
LFSMWRSNFSRRLLSIDTPNLTSCAITHPVLFFHGNRATEKRRCQICILKKPCIPRLGHAEKKPGPYKKGPVHRGSAFRLPCIAEVVLFAHSNNS